LFKLKEKTNKKKLSLYLALDWNIFESRRVHLAGFPLWEVSYLCVFCGKRKKVSFPAFAK